MSWFAGLLASIKALGFVSKFGGLLSLVPGVGPVMSFVGAAISAIFTALSYICKSFKECVLHPVTLVAMAVVFAVGMVTGIKFDAKLVDDSRIEVRNYVKAAQGAINVEKGKTAAAREVADAAEKRARDREVPPLNTTALCAAPPVKPSGVRNYRKPTSLYTIPGMSGF